MSSVVARRPRRACRDSIVARGLKDVTQERRNTMGTRRPVKVKSKAEPLGSSDGNSPKRRKINIQSTTEDEQDSTSFELSSEDSDYSPEKGSRSQPFSRHSKKRPVRMDSSSDSDEDTAVDEFSNDELSFENEDLVDSDTVQPVTKNRNGNKPRVKKSTTARRAKSSKSRQPVSPKRASAKSCTRKATSGRTSEQPLGASTDSSEDEWLEADPVTVNSGAPRDDLYDEISKLVRTTENVSFDGKPPCDTDSNSDNLHELEVKVKCKKKKAASKKGCLTYEEEIIMLLKRNMNKIKKNTRENLHKVHILTLLHLGRKFQELVKEDGQIYGLVMSLKQNWEHVNGDELDVLEEIGLKLKLPTERSASNRRFCDRTKDFREKLIIDQIESSVISDQYALVVVLSICASLRGTRTRIVHNIDPLPFKEPTTAQSTLLTKKREQLLKSYKAVEFANCWLEQYDEKAEKWCVADFYQNHKVLNPLKRLAPMPSYIFAFTNKYTRDVTARYDPQWLTSTKKIRVASYDKPWWLAVQKTMERDLPKREKNLEDRALQQMLLGQSIPKTISAFKGHPLYALERHLLKYEAFYPEDIAPVTGKSGEPLRIRDESIYPRTAVKTLHTQDKWLQLARQLLPHQRPYKYVASWYRNKKLGLDSDSENLGLFGEWQTEPFKPPVIDDAGIIPRNQYGNVNLYKPEMCPINGRHVSGHEGLDDAASQIGLDAVRAVIGWDADSRLPVPKYDGWIIHEKTADKLLKHYASKKAEIHAALEKAKAERIKKEDERRKYPCKYCGKKLTAVKNRKVHIKMKHPDKQPY